MTECALKGEGGDVYNLASGVETSISELATRINNLTGNKAGFEYLPRRPWDNSGKRFGSTVKSERELGFMATVALKDGLIHTIDWTKKNLHVIEAAISKHTDKMKN